MTRGRWIAVLAGAMLLAGGLAYAGWLAWSEVRAARSLATEAMERADEAEAEAQLVRDELVADVREVDQSVSAIEDALTVGSGNVESALSDLRSDIRALRQGQGSVVDFVAEYVGAALADAGVKKPAFCFGGDAVYWDYGGGLTC